MFTIAAIIALSTQPVTLPETRIISSEYVCSVRSLSQGSGTVRTCERVRGSK